MEPEKEEQPSLLDRLMSNIGPNAPEDSPGYFRVPTFPAIRSKIQYKKPIQLADYAGYEDLYRRWEQQKPNWFGTRPTLEQKVDDFEGHGPGKIIVRSKSNAGPEGIYFYPANTEFNKALAQDTRDIADIQFIGGTITSVLAAAKGGYRLRAHQKRQLETMRANEATYVGSNAPQLKGRIQKQIESIVTGKVTKEDPIALGKQEFDPGTPGVSGPYAYQSTRGGTIEPGDTLGGHLGYYSSKFPDTKKRDLNLYGANIRTFTKFNNFEDALAAGEVSNQQLLDTGKKRWAGIDAQIGDSYFKIYKGLNNEIRILPYNKWYQLKRNPFKVPDDVKTYLKKFESRQLELIDPNSNEVVKYDKGTVDRFVKYVNKEIGFQKEQQQLIENMGKAIYRAAGVPYKRGKTWLSVDLSHAVPRSKGGPGYTFLEGWRENQTRGAIDILDDQILIDLGIPRNWEEYFLRWYQEQGTGNPATDLGRLADISWDDYNAAQQGVDINLIKLRRNTINHLIQRQIADSTTFQKPGQRGATIGDDFEIMIKESKGLALDADIIGSSPETTWSAKEFDLRWRAMNYNKKQSLKTWTQLEKNQLRIKNKKRGKVNKNQKELDLYSEYSVKNYREYMEILLNIPTNIPADIQKDLDEDE
tara:strand:+ start:1585 stop:3513 length:1929 start_codon:yes stop_codon:yes gene_type:complete